MGRKTSSANWREQAKNYKAQAERLPYGNEREALEMKARQLDIASHINEWVSSPSLQPPNPATRVRRKSRRLARAKRCSFWIVEFEAGPTGAGNDFTIVTGSEEAAP